MYPKASKSLVNVACSAVFKGISMKTLLGLKIDFNSNIINLNKVLQLSCLV